MKLVDILVKRDGISKDEAEARVDDVRGNFEDLIADGNFEDAYYIMEDLGLEPDYLDEFI